MTVLLFLNELSSAEPCEKAVADRAVGRLVQLLRHVSRLRSNAALVSDAKLKELELMPGYCLREWAGQPRNRDLWRFIRGMENRAPHSAVLPDGAGEGVEYFCNGVTGRGLGAAHLMDGLLVSLLVSERWDTPWVHAVRDILDETPGALEPIITEEVDVRHAATVGHLEVHDDWLKQVGILDLGTGAEIWEERAAIFPHIQFLDRVEKQMRELRQDWVIPAALELRRIDEAIADWDPAIRPVPSWRSLITPEHERRRKLCTFADSDGEARIFDWHGRFTPGAGRVYFRLVPEIRKARVANIGLKLGILLW